MIKLERFVNEETVQDWRYNVSQTCTAHFWVDRNNKGDRVVRVTEFNEKTSAPKRGPYYLRASLVWCSDGKLRYVGHSPYNILHVMSCNMKHEDFHITEKEESFSKYMKELYNLSEGENDGCK